MNVGSLIFEIAANTARLQQDMARATQTVDKAMGDIKSIAMKTAAALGVTISAGAFAGWIKGAIDTEVQLGRLAQGAGETIEQFSALASAMKKAGQIDAETLKGSLKDLDKQIAQASGGSKQAQVMFRALGIEIKDNVSGEARKGSEVMLDLAAAFAKAKDDPIKTAYAIALMGKAGDEMIPALNKGRNELERLMQQARDTGKVLGEDTFKQAEQFTQQLNTLKSSSGMLARTLANDLLPELNAITKAMIEGKKEAGFLGGIFQALGRFMFTAFGGLDNPVQNAARDVVTLTDQVMSLEKALQGMSSSVNPGVRARLEQQIAEKKAELDKAQKLFQTLEQSASEEERKRKEREEADKKGKRSLDASGLRGDAEAEYKRFISALQSLEKEYASLTQEGRVAVTQWETEKGGLRELTKEHKAELLVVSERIDAYRRELALRAMVVQGIEAQVAAHGRAIEAVHDQAVASREQTNELEFQASLLGKSSREQERLNAARRIELDLRQRIAGLPRDEDGNLLRGGGEAITQMRAQAEAQKATTVRMVAERQAAERDWLTGVKEGFHEYVDEATNAAAMAKKTFLDAFRGMEDALVTFVKTGKLNFSSLADTIITDLIRIQVRQGITAPLASAIGEAGFGSIFKNAFSGFFADGGTIPAGGFGIVGERGPEPVFGPATVLPNSSLGGGSGGGGTANVDVQGGDTYIIDARGADAGQVARLEAAIRQVNGSIERRSVAAVVAAFNNRGFATPLG